MAEENKVNEDDAIGFLNELDRQGGINSVEEIKEEPVKSLGKSSYHQQLEMSGAEESPWKILNLNLLPSRGRFYHKDSELLIRSAKTKEIRHWSTMDEYDPIDVKEKINFILNSCTKFKIKGSASPLNFNDFCEIDKYHILFRIYELTFPNQENKLFANIRCNDTKCSHVNKVQVTSQNLIGFDIPEELFKWYSEENRCFVVPSERLQQTLIFYMPTIGMSSKLAQRKKIDSQNGTEVDSAFYSYSPYLLNDWRQIRMEDLGTFKIESVNWSREKFTVIYKFTESLKKSSLNKATSVCEKCKSRVESHIFLGGSFTTKDIFIISAGLDELI
jgi:hypothetical protein